MNKVAVKCPACKEDADFNEFRLLEGALLVCPNCGAEFSLTATVEKLPDGSEEPGEEPLAGLDLEPEPEPAPPPAEMPELPPEDLAASKDTKRTPVVRVGVLECSDCGASWVGTHVTKCLSCGKEAVLRSTKTVLVRTEEMLAEVARGVPSERALNKLLGRFHVKSKKE